MKYLHNFNESSVVLHGKTLDTSQSHPNDDIVNELIEEQLEYVKKKLEKNEINFEELTYLLQDIKSELKKISNFNYKTYPKSNYSLMQITKIWHSIINDEEEYVKNINNAVKDTLEKDPEFNTKREEAITKRRKEFNYDKDKHINKELKNISDILNDTDKYNM